MSASDLQKQLPVSLPDMARFDMGYLQSPFAVYNLASLNQSDFTDLVSTADVDLDGLHLAKPVTQLFGNDLRSIVDAHIGVAESQGTENKAPEFNPHTFIVAAHSSWKDRGCLVVSLNYDGTGSVDSYEMPVDKCTANLMAIELGESSWEETKGEATIALPQQPTPSTRSVESSTDQASQRWTKELRHFCVYNSVQGVNMRELLGILNAEAGPGLDDWPCRNPPWLSFVRLQGDDEANRKTIVSLHQGYLPRYQGFRPELVVIADHVDFGSKGLLIGYIGEDGALSVRRVPVKQATASLIAIAKGEESHP